MRVKRGPRTVRAGRATGDTHGGMPRKVGHGRERAR